ncbi:MAG: hypothetical protein AAFX40_18355, partial [Cyanobacteria bacterium J06639_1]
MTDKNSTNKPDTSSVFPQSISVSLDDTSYAFSISELTNKNGDRATAEISQAKKSLFAASAIAGSIFGALTLVRSMREETDLNDESDDFDKWAEQYFSIDDDLNHALELIDISDARIEKLQA